MRIVLDTNVVVSGLISSKGPPGRLIRAWLDGRFHLVTSQEQIDELRRVLSYARLRTHIHADQARDFMENLEAFASIAGELSTLELSPDPDDNAILATAVGGQADLLVSGDKNDVLALGHVEGIPILAAKEALERLRLTDE